ncbi:hypothetical protein LDENG_00038940 [Lucifuga dentata]|nr:hypothetical protein LDENG_00038940 [Lucifuga dentata]
MEAGLSSLVTGFPLGEGLTPVEAVLSTLTRKQAATVKKKLENYNETLKKRNRQPIRDVREIFTVTDDDSAERSSSPPSDGAESASRGRYHTTTKTIRRHTARVRPPFPNFLLEDQLPENTPSPTHTHTSTHTESQTRQADWLVRESPYSEGIADHKHGGTCWDCLRFPGDNNDLLFIPVPPGPGLTLVDDLSSADVTRLGFISHIELSTFLSGLGIHIKRTRPPRRRSQESGVIGVPLSVLLENDRKKFPGIKVPVVFQKLLCILEQTGLQTEGILRVPGSAARLKYLRAELDRCCGGLDWSAVRQVDAAGLLKLFIRELPTPVLTHTHLSTYHAVLGISSLVHRVQALHLLLLLLPEVNRDTLKALLVFLRKVVLHQDQNRMSLWNVSMVMAPNLFTCRHHGNKHSAASQQEEMEEAVGGAQLVQLMITHQDLLWTVPSFLLSQVRQMTQASNQKQPSLLKTKRRLLMRKSDKNEQNQVTELHDGVIRVHAPLHTKVSMAIQLDGQTRAKDVTARFQLENSPAQRLYEVGGNIGERRLHPDCVLLEVYRVNPHCEWVLKP